jgi:hypothetical protein
VCVRACARARVRACVRARVRACAPRFPSTTPTRRRLGADSEACPAGLGLCAPSRLAVHFKFKFRVRVPVAGGPRGFRVAAARRNSESELELAAVRIRNHHGDPGLVSESSRPAPGLGFGPRTAASGGWPRQLEIRVGPERAGAATADSDWEIMADSDSGVRPWQPTRARLRQPAPSPADSCWDATADSDSESGVPVARAAQITCSRLGVGHGCRLGLGSREGAAVGRFQVASGDVVLNGPGSGAGLDGTSPSAGQPDGKGPRCSLPWGAAVEFRVGG